MRKPGATPHSGGVAPVVWFFALAYLLSWAWWVPLALDEQLVRRGDGWPTHIPGLAGPFLAALTVLAFTEGRSGLRGWLTAMVRVPPSWRWWLASVAPLGFLGVGLAVVAATGDPPPARDFVAYSGAAATAGALALAVLVNVFGEEAGWRGYALPRLQHRFGPLRGVLVLAVPWAGWHTPLFFLLASYQDFGVFTVVGFFVGITAGAVVLAFVYNGTGGSIFAAALWHAAYNLSAATSAADGTIAAVSTALVIFWAVSLVQRERAGLPTLGGERR